MNITQAKARGITILDKAPEGWSIIQGTMTEPIGYRWWCNMKTIASGERQTALVKEEQ